MMIDFSKRNSPRVNYSPSFLKALKIKSKLEKIDAEADEEKPTTLSTVEVRLVMLAGQAMRRCSNAGPSSAR
jgi:hypothetical protein